MTIEEAYRGIVKLLNLSEEDPQFVLKSVTEMVNIQDNRLLQRFFNKVEKKPDGCWIWTSSSKQIRIGKHLVLASRYSWYLRHGEFPPKNWYVHRKCSSVGCVNPEHLFLKKLCVPKIDDDMSSIRPVS